MARRGRMGRGHSQRNFRSAARSHGKNSRYRAGPMRGGIRL